MNVRLTPDQEFLVRQGIAAGRYRDREDAIRDALARWEDSERRRAELVGALDEAELSIAGGESQEITTESMRALAERVKQRGRLMLATEPPDVS